MCKLFWRLVMEILPDINQDNYWCIIRKVTWNFRKIPNSSQSSHLYCTHTRYFQKYFYLAWQHGITAIIRRVRNWQYCVENHLSLGKSRLSILMVGAEIWQGQNICVAIWNKNSKNNKNALRRSAPRKRMIDAKKIRVYHCKYIKIYKS